jgi:hypothetical protein
MSTFLRAVPDTPTPPPPRDDYQALYPSAPRTLTAGAMRINPGDAKIMARLRESSSDRLWQRRAWHAFEQVGEVHFAFTLVANLISRVRFYAAGEADPNSAPAAVHDIKDLTPGLAEATQFALDRISKNDSLSDIARDLALNLNVPGEAYLVQTPSSNQLTPTGFRETPESWDIRSIDEVVVPSDSSTPIKIRTTPASPTTYSGRTDATTYEHPPTAFIGRIWRKDPRFSSLADSSLRAVLDLIDELAILTQTFKATARSRLNSGILFVPDGLSVSANPSSLASPYGPPELATPNPTQLAPDGGFAPSPNQSPSLSPASPQLPFDPNAVLPDEDEFEQALIDAMITPISDPSGVSAVAPIIVRGPTDLGEKIKLITFERTFDPSLVQRADRVLERILQGLDLPSEVVSGVAKLKYANSIVVEDSLFRSHIEPLIVLICDAITEVYLRPAVEAAGYTTEQVARIRIWYDPSAVVARPNRSQDAVSLFDRYSLSSSALRDATGFNESDAPSPTELILRMLLQKGPISPELSEALMRSVAPMMMEATRQAAQASSDNPLPPEVQDLLGGSAAGLTPPAPTDQPAAAASAPTPERPGNATPAQPADAESPAPATPGNISSPPEPRGPRPGRPTTNPPSSTPPLLPPRTPR